MSMLQVPECKPMEIFPLTILDLMNLKEDGGVVEDSLNEDFFCDVEDEDLPTMADPFVKAVVFTSPIAPRGEGEGEHLTCGPQPEKLVFTDLVEIILWTT